MVVLCTEALQTGTILVYVPRQHTCFYRTRECEGAYIRPQTCSFSNTIWQSQRLRSSAIRKKLRNSRRCPRSWVHLQKRSARRQRARKSAFFVVVFSFKKYVLVLSPDLRKEKGANHPSKGKEENNNNLSNHMSSSGAKNGERLKAHFRSWYRGAQINQGPLENNKYREQTSAVLRSKRK